MNKSDYLALAGCVLIAYGCYAIYHPLAPIFAGAILVKLGIGLRKG